MSATAFTAFIIALLLAIDAIEPSGPWLVALAVLTGLSALRPRRIARVWLGGELFFMVALAAFIISVLLAISALEWTDTWFVTLTALTGLLAFVPRRVHWGRRRWRRRWATAWAGSAWDDDPWAGMHDW